MVVNRFALIALFQFCFDENGIVVRRIVFPVRISQNSVFKNINAIINKYVINFGVAIQSVWNCHAALPNGYAIVADLVTQIVGWSL